MKIEIMHGKDIVSPHTGKLLLPEMDITAEAKMDITGFPADVPHFLHYSQLGEEYAATFFLHPHITAHVHSGDFDIYLTNNDTLVGCFVCSKSGYFKVTQLKERIATYTSQAFYDFFIVEDDKVYVIESGETKETDKHASLI